MHIKNKIVLITGGASGMGAVTAKHLHKLGAQIAILDKQIDQAKEVAASLGGLAIDCDVSSEENVAHAIKTVVEQWGDIHVCVNCAGVVSAGRIVSKNGVLPLNEFRRVIEINLIGSFNVMRLVAAQMTTQRVCSETTDERGVLINTASIAAFEGQVGQVSYSAAKGGIVSMTLPAARELARFGIRVMAIAPGIMDTPMMAGMPPPVRAALTEEVMFPKRLGQPDEFAQLVQTIITNSYLNGTVIRLDGGLRLR